MKNTTKVSIAALILIMFVFSACLGSGTNGPLLQDQAAVLARFHTMIEDTAGTGRAAHEWDGNDWNRLLKYFADPFSLHFSEEFHFRAVEQENFSTVVHQEQSFSHRDWDQLWSAADNGADLETLLSEDELHLLEFNLLFFLFHEQDWLEMLAADHAVPGFQITAGFPTASRPAVSIHGNTATLVQEYAIEGVDQQGFFQIPMVRQFSYELSYVRQDGQWFIDSAAGKFYFEMEIHFPENDRGFSA